MITAPSARLLHVHQVSLQTAALHLGQGAEMVQKLMEEISGPIEGQSRTTVNLKIVEVPRINILVIFMRFAGEGRTTVNLQLPK